MSVTVTGIPSEEAFGEPRVLRTAYAGGIGSDEAFGSPRVNRSVKPDGIGSEEAFGEPRRRHTVYATGIPSEEAFGTPKMNRKNHAVGIESEELFGRPFSAPTLNGRPIYEFRRNWADAPAHRFQYQLNNRVLGRSSPRVERLQTHTIQGFDFNVRLNSEALIDDHDRWGEYLRGRLEGFWIASPFDVFQIASNTSSNQLIYLKGQGLADVFANHPSNQYLVLYRGTQRYIGKIASVVKQTNERELVTLQSSVGATIDSTWSAAKLLYVRFANDDEEGTFYADNRQERRVRVVELPTEYAEIETGQLPVYLYEFYMATPGGNIYWRFTGLTRDVLSNGGSFVSFAIEHSDHVRSINREQSFKIESFYDARNPLARVFPNAMSKPIWLKVYETTYQNPESRTLIFHGRVEDCSLEGQVISADCSSVLEVLGRKFPRMIIQPRCNYFLFTTPCGVSKTSFDAAVKIDELNGRYVSVSAAPGGPGTPDVFTTATYNYFALGYIETGSGVNYEVRQIDRSTAYASPGQITLTLDRPLNFAAVSQTATIYAGCDGTAATCKDKFNNFKRWGGHVIAPGNPSIRAVQAAAATGNKK